jgi:hypothetical protein
MAKMTFKYELVNTEWTIIAAGSAYSSFGLMCSSGSALIFIGDSEPAIGETDVMPISSADTREITVDLPNTMTLYARAEDDDATINGFRVPA